MKKQPSIKEEAASDNDYVINWSRTVLIVEDDQYNAHYLKQLFANTGLRIVHTEFGQQAIDIVLSQSIDIVLMDIRLPDMNGYEAIRQIKKQKPDQKIIAQTAYASEIDKQKALELGCIDYISKPVKKEILFSKMHTHLS